MVSFHLKFSSLYFSNFSRLQDETSRVEDELLKPSSLDTLLQCFVSAKANSFENLLDPFLKITRLSTPITIAMTKSSAFFQRIVDRLGHNSKAVVRLNLLRLVRGVCEVHPNRAVLVERYGLLGVVERLSRGGGDGAVLVRELAREIVPSLKPALKPVVGKPGPHGQKVSSALAPRRMRRAASETAALPPAIGIPSGHRSGASLSNSGLSESPVSGTGMSSKLGIGATNGSAKAWPPPSRQRLGDISWQTSASRGS